MEQVSNWVSNQTELQKKIFIIVGVVMALIILCPLKVIVTKNPLFDQVHTKCPDII